MAEDALCEIILSDIGELTIALDPGLTFRPDGFSVEGASITLKADADEMRIAIPDHIDMEELSEVDQLLLIEISADGSRMEVDLSKL